MRSSEKSHQSGGERSFEYDKLNRLTKVIFDDDKTQEMEYDFEGNLLKKVIVTSSAGTTVWQYEYDWLDRLYKVKKGTTTSNTLDTAIYTYDDLDNATVLEMPQAFLQYDFKFTDADEIEERKETNTNTSMVNFTENFTSDDDGNVLTRTRTVGADIHQITYEWDDFNKLISVASSLNGTPSTEAKQNNTFGVNGFRRKKVKKDGSLVSEYAAGLSTAVSKSAAATYSYIQGPQILGFLDDSDNLFVFIHDALGSVRDIVRGTDGVAVQAYSYDERGQQPVGSGTGSVDSPKTFIGGMSVNDDTGDSGLYLMGHRHYDPSLGRFLSRDPIGFAGDLNLYRYANGNPSTYNDPTGLRVPSPVASFFRGFATSAVVALAGSALLAFGGAAGLAIVATATIVGIGLFAADILGRVGTGQGYTLDEGAEILGGIAGGGLGSKALPKFRGASERSSMSPIRVKNPCRPTGIPGVMSFSDDAVSQFMSNNMNIFSRKLGRKIGQGRLPFSRGRAGFDQAKEVVRQTLLNATDVSGEFIMSGPRPAYEVYSANTGFSVRVSPQAEFITLIHGPTGRI